jgi:hypothetical protein
MNTYEEAKVQIFAFLISTLDGAEGLNSSQEKSPRYILDRRLCGPKADASTSCGDEKLSLTLTGIKTYP